MSRSDSFQSRLYELAVREGTESFAWLVAKYPEERFYAFTFYTNNDLQGVYPFANTVEGLELAGLGLNSEEKWIAGEWRLELDGDSKNSMSKTTLLLIEAVDEYSNDEASATTKYGPYEGFRRDAFRTLSCALLAIREAGMFRDHSLHDRIAFWVHVGDPDGDGTELMFQFAVEHLATEDVDQLRQFYGFD